MSTNFNRIFHFTSFFLFKVYEPTNPNADWAGFVSRDQMQKKHISTDHSSRMSSLQREEGIFYINVFV